MLLIIMIPFIGIFSNAAFLWQQIKTIWPAHWPVPCARTECPDKMSENVQVLFRRQNKNKKKTHWRHQCATLINFFVLHWLWHRRIRTLCVCVFCVWRKHAAIKIEHLYRLENSSNTMQKKYGVFLIGCFFGFIWFGAIPIHIMHKI